jgi:hypothetical protein
MDWIGLIRQLVDCLFDDHSEIASLLELLGQPTERDDDVWRLEPSAPLTGALKEALLEFEDSEGASGLVGSVELELAQPWRSLPMDISKALGSSAHLVPAEPATLIPGVRHAPRPTTFAYYLERDGKNGAVLVTGSPVGPGPADPMDIVEIVVRREYD